MNNLRSAVAGALGLYGAGILNAPDRLCSLIADHVDPESREMRVLWSYCDDELLKPFLMAMPDAGNRHDFAPLAGAASVARRHLYKNCAVDDAVAKNVAGSIALGIADYLGIAPDPKRAEQERAERERRERERAERERAERERREQERVKQKRRERERAERERGERERAEQERREQERAERERLRLEAERERAEQERREQERAERERLRQEAEWKRAQEQKGSKDGSTSGSQQDTGKKTTKTWTERIAEPNISNKRRWFCTIASLCFWPIAFVIYFVNSVLWDHSHAFDPTYLVPDRSDITAVVSIMCFGVACDLIRMIVRSIVRKLSAKA